MDSMTAAGQALLDDAARFVNAVWRPVTGLLNDERQAWSVMLEARRRAPGRAYRVHGHILTGWTVQVRVPRSKPSDQ
jgi:hypothetical protein